MYTLKTLSVLALAATTFAAPTPAEDVNALEARGYAWRGGNRFWNRPYPGAVVTVDGYGDDAPAAEETAAPEPTTTAAPAPEITTSVAAPAAPIVTYTPEAPSQPSNNGWGAPQASSAPAATSTQAAAQPSQPPASVGSGGDWFDIANKWRTAGGLSAFTQDATLVANAQKTADDSVGGLKHELNPGTFAQVLAPGDASNFESVYVGGWLCEIPNLAGLNGICSTAAQGWSHDGQTGHATILTGSYKKIGCALSKGTGVWACDLA